MEKKPILLDREGLQKSLGLHGIVGKCASGLLYSVLGLNRLNKGYPVVAHLHGPEFCAASLRELGISYELLPGQEEYIPREGGFFTVSNHHFGGADGMILDAVVGGRREDFKILTTFLLASVPNLKDTFIPVDNFSSGKARSVAGIRRAKEHVAGGGALGLFPAGEVGTWQKKGRRTALSGKRVVEDKPWPENISKLIKTSGLPVVPVYFDGGNSKTFHILGRIHPILRTLRLVREFTNKNGTTVKVRIGKPIPAEQIAGMETEALGKYLRSRCYALEAQCRAPFKESASKVFEDLAAPVDPELVRKGMESLDADKVLFEVGDYRVYLIEAKDAPDVMRELYRLREETFRAVGEGTGAPADTDSFDEYFRHLILWNIPNGEIVGSYRVGYGPDIYEKRGVEGFYTSSLVRYGAAAEPVLARSLELGRSFIAVKYQREVLPLKLLLSGMMVAVAKDPRVEYCIGLVSISNSLPDLYKSLAVHFLERDFRLPDAEAFVSPPHPFKKDFLRIDPDDLLQGIAKGDIDALDRLLISMSDGKYRLPVLLRKYFNSGARVACFNVDPCFCNSLDGMIVMRVSDFPTKMLNSFIRPLPEAMREKVVKHLYGTSISEGK